MRLERRGTPARRLERLPKKVALLCRDQPAHLLALGRQTDYLEAAAVAGQASGRKNALDTRQRRPAAPGHPLLPGGYDYAYNSFR